MQNQELMTQSANSAPGDVAPDVACLPDKIVNLYFVGAPRTNGAGADGGGWVLVDAGLYGSANRIARSGRDGTRIADARRGNAAATR